MYSQSLMSSTQYLQDFGTSVIPYIPTDCRYASVQRITGDLQNCTDIDAILEERHISSTFIS